MDKVEKTINRFLTYFDPKGSWYAVNKDIEEPRIRSNQYRDQELDWLIGHFHTKAQELEKLKRTEENLKVRKHIAIKGDRSILEETEEDRTEFEGREIHSPVTGLPDAYFPPRDKVKRILGSYVQIVLCIFYVSCVNAGIFYVHAYVSRYPLRNYVDFHHLADGPFGVPTVVTNLALASNGGPPIAPDVHGTCVGEQAQRSARASRSAAACSDVDVPSPTAQPSSSHTSWFERHTLPTSRLASASGSASCCSTAVRASDSVSGDGVTWMRKSACTSVLASPLIERESSCSDFLTVVRSASSTAP